jgi:hypothetical protein
VSRSLVVRGSALLAAVGLAVTLALSPAGAAPASAASSPKLTLVGTTRYLVQPEKRRVHVTVDLVATNRTTETISTRYVFDHANLAVLPGTTGFRATDDGVKASVTVAGRSAASTLLSIRFAKRLGGGKSTSIRLSFELPDPGGSPSRQVRIGPSLVAFPVWAYGTRGTAGSSVSIQVPAGYKVTVGAGRLGKPTSAADGSTSLSSGVLADPFSLSGYVLADRPGAFAETAFSVPVDGATVQVAIRAWKEDPAWAKKTAAFLKKALPALSATIGLPYRGPTTITVEETVARSIEGSAGIYDPASGTLRLAYVAGPSVVLREAAYLWFAGMTFADRWIVEGLAADAADGAAVRLKLAPPSGSATVAPSQPAFPLNAWPAEPGRDPESVAAEAYGRAASAQLIRLVVARTGAEGLRAAIRAAAARGAAEPVDWRGLLDLLGSEAGLDATELWRTWVMRPQDSSLLDARALARFQLAELKARADGWTLPAEIEADLAGWRFEQASAAIARASAVLAARDELAVAAAVAGLDLPPSLRTAFEAGAADAAGAEAAVERAIIDQIVAAEQAGAATSSSWLVRIGLLGQDPVGELAAARAAFAAGDLSAAQARAIGAREAWDGASDLGGLRLRTIGAFGLVAALAVLLIATRARRQPRRAGTGYETEPF